MATTGDMGMARGQAGSEVVNPNLREVGPGEAPPVEVEPAPAEAVEAHPAAVELGAVVEPVVVEPAGTPTIEGAGPPSCPRPLPLPRSLPLDP